MVYDNGAPLRHSGEQVISTLRSKKYRERRAFVIFTKDRIISTEPCGSLDDAGDAAFGKPATHIPDLEDDMGILEEAAGAFAAVEGAKKLDPNAGIVTEGIAAIAGFEGTKVVTDLIEKKEEENKDSQG